MHLALNEITKSRIILAGVGHSRAQDEVNSPNVMLPSCLEENLQISGNVKAMKIYDPGRVAKEGKRAASKLKRLAKLKMLKAADGNKLNAFLLIVSLRARKKNKGGKGKLTQTVLALPKTLNHISTVFWPGVFD